MSDYRCRHCRPIPGLPGWYSCYTQEETRLVKGERNGSDGCVRHIAARDVTHGKLTEDDAYVGVKWDGKVVDRGAHQGFADAFRVAMERGILAHCTHCKRTVRSAGLKHHQRGMLCVSRRNRLEMAATKYTLEYARDERIPVALIKNRELCKRDGSRQALRSVPTIPEWVSSMLFAASYPRSALIETLIAERLIAHQDQSDRASHRYWQYAVSAMSAALVSSFLAACHRDPDERDFALSLLTNDVEQWLTYLVSSNPALFIELTNRVCEDIVTRKAIAASGGEAFTGYSYGMKL